MKTPTIPRIMPTRLSTFEGPAAGATYGVAAGAAGGTDAAGDAGGTGAADGSGGTGGRFSSVIETPSVL
jgi:hypothetical protein